MLIALNKPYLVLSKFTDEQARPTLAQFGLPKRVRPVGRLDHDSEGLILLSDDGAEIHRYTDPRRGTPKTYLSQVEGLPSAGALQPLVRGVMLADGPALPASAQVADEPSWLWPRTPPIRFRKSIPTAWVEVTIREGRNRQVRRMTAAVGFPTLRLVRIAVGPHRLDGLAPGQWRQLQP